MDKKELEKNILDLKYQFQMKKMKISLTMLTVGFLSFLGTFIWYGERLVFGIAVSVVIILISSIFYFRTKKQLRNIVFDIEN